MSKVINHNDNYFIFLPKNPIEGMLTVCCLSFRPGTLLYIGPPPSYLSAIHKLPLLGALVKNKLSEYNKRVGDYKSLWYEISELTIKLTNEFYDENRSHLAWFVNYLNQEYSTNKFEAFIKKRICLKTFELLKVLHLTHNSDKRRPLILANDKLTKYIADKFRTQNASDIKLIFLDFPASILTFFVYVQWLIADFARRGFSWRRKRRYFKLLIEATSGFSRKVLRDDILIDGKYFVNGDVLFCQFHRNDPSRNNAFDEAKIRGFHTISAVHCPFNIRINFLRILYRYFLAPLILYIRLMRLRCSYLLYDFLQFFMQGLPVEALMNSYEIGVNISFIDHDDISRTIVFNNYGAKNSIFHWSDMTPVKDFSYAFIAHNIYFVWGDIHYDYHSENFFVDKKVNVGCIFKEEYNRVAKNAKDIIFQLLGDLGGKKIVTFFDNSYNNYTPGTEQFLLEYLDMIRDFSSTNRDFSVLLKPKNDGCYEKRITKTNIERFFNIWDELIGYANFRCIDPAKWDMPEAIAISDVCVNMGMTSPATVVLICGKNALYFDSTGNIHHPFVRKYKNVLVFDDRKLLFKQLNRILHGEFDCHDILKGEEIRSYDAFSDDGALERIRKSLNEIVCAAK